MNLTYTLLTDGSSDKALIPIIDWVFGKFSGIRLTSQFAEVSPRQSSGLLNRARAAINVYECDILLVHRDAETIGHEMRIAEIRDRLAEFANPYVPIVPVRMSESWLLIDEQAIRSAASNPNGKVPLDLPSSKRLEDVANPKSMLFEKLRLASELPPNRLRKFKPEQCRHRVAELISDFSPLRNIPAFNQFENDLNRCVAQMQGN